MVSDSPAPAAIRWLPHFGLLALIWGSSFLFIKVAVVEIHPMHLSLFRVGLGAATLLAIIWLTRARLPREPRVWGHLAIIAMLGNVAPFTLFAYGEQHVSSGLAGIWNATTPLTTMLVLALVFRVERLGRARVAGLITGFLGVMVVLGVWAGVGTGPLIGQSMCFAAATCYAFAGPLMKRWVAGRAETGVALAGAQMLMATLELLLIAPAVAGLPDLTGVSLGALASVVALGALGTGIAFVLNYHVIRVAGVATTAAVTYLMPIVAVGAGVIVLNEELRWHQPVGALVVLLGVAISQGVPSRILSRVQKRRIARSEPVKVT